MLHYDTLNTEERAYLTANGMLDAVSPGSQALPTQAAAAVAAAPAQRVKPATSAMRQRAAAPIAAQAATPVTAIGPVADALGIQPQVLVRMLIRAALGLLLVLAFFAGLGRAVAETTVMEPGLIIPFDVAPIPPSVAPATPVVGGETVRLDQPKRERKRAVRPPPPASQPAVLTSIHPSVKEDVEVFVPAASQVTTPALQAPAVISRFPVDVQSAARERVPDAAPRGFGSSADLLTMVSLMMLVLLALYGLRHRRPRALSTVPGRASQRIAPAAATCRSAPVTVAANHDAQPRPSRLFAGTAALQGHVRARMEDRAKMVRRQDIVAVVIADGVGGMPYGGEAAEAASDAAVGFLAADASATIACVDAAFAVAARSVARGAALAGVRYGEGYRTTLLIVVADATRAAWGYAGDGAIVHLRAEDRAVTELLVPQHDADGALTASLGPQGQWGNPRFGLYALQAGDAVVAGTDGCMDRCATRASFAAWLVDMGIHHRQGTDLSAGLNAALTEFVGTRDANNHYIADDNASCAVLVLEQLASPASGSHLTVPLAVAA